MKIMQTYFPELSIILTAVGTHTVDGDINHLSSTVWTPTGGLYPLK